MSPDPLPAFLAHFPDRHHHYLTAWFAYSLAQGAQTADGVLQIVRRVAERKLEWSTSETSQDLCRGVLLALTLHRPEAVQYAETLLEGKDDHAA